jgi:hypothetical protein
MERVVAVLALAVASDAATRQQAEVELAQLSVHPPPFLVLGYPAVLLTVPWDGAAAAYGPTLCEVLLAPSLPLPTRQLAGMALKRLVAQHWTPLDGEHVGWTLADEVRRATPLCPLHRPLLTSLRMATPPPHPSTRRPCAR